MDLKLLKSMVEIDSSTEEGQNKVIDVLKDYLSKKANKVKIIGKDRKNILAFFGDQKSKNILLINGHIDSVKADKKDFKFNPFSLTEQDELLYGRGTGDMKGGVFCSINAIVKASEQKLLKNKLVIFAGTCDEETGSDSPYGASVAVDYFLKENLMPKACLIPEPNRFQQPFKINLGHRGLLWIKAISTGIKMHSASFDKEDNAIVNMMDFLTELRKKLSNQPKKDRNGVPSSSARVTSFVCNNSEFNVVPSMCESNIDVRISPFDRNKDVLKLIQKMAVKFGVKIEVLKNTPSSFVKKKERIVQETILACEENGFDYEVGYSSATNDAHFFNNAKIPTVVGLGVEAKNVHANDECILKKSLQKTEQILFDIIKRW